MSDKNCFITVPEVTLPNGTIVPSFQVGQYPTSKDDAGAAVVTAFGVPWVEINYHDAKAAAAAAGFNLITELQWLALAHDIANQDANWTGGKVGQGKLYQGLHKWTAEEPQPGTYEPADPEERTWHALSNGERIYHFSGNVFSWVFDDVQGDESGLVSKSFAKDSPSITTAPAPSMEQGVGWLPRAGADWSGYALVRGGYWYSDANAGVFRLGDVWPDLESDRIGCRCTN